MFFYNIKNNKIEKINFILLNLLPMIANNYLNCLYKKRIKTNVSKIN